MNDAAITRTLDELGLELPPVNPPIAAYVPVVAHGTIAHVSGQIPMREGAVMHPGQLGADITVEQAHDAARQAGLQALAALKDALGGSFARLERILQVTIYVNSASGFTSQPQVGNGASELLVAVLGEAGRHARAAVGVAALPLGASVEVALTAAITAA